MHKSKKITSRSWAVIWAFITCLSLAFLLSPPEFKVQLFSQVPSTIPPAKRRVELRPRLFDLSPLRDFENEFLAEHVSKASWVAVKDSFSLPILPQPEDNGVYVTNRLNLITQFGRPAQNGITALLAHNYRSGKEFYNLKVGQQITVTYDEGLSRDYQVVSIDRFQKLEPANLYSKLVDLGTNQELSSTEVYNRYYSGAHHVTFQTCLEGEGRLDWGLFFVVADPVDQVAKK